MNYSGGAAWMEGRVIPVSEAKISVFDWGLTRSDIHMMLSMSGKAHFFGWKTT